MPLQPVWTPYLDMERSVLKINSLRTKAGRAFSSQQHHCMGKSELFWKLMTMKTDQSPYSPQTLLSDHRRYKICLKLWDKVSARGNSWRFSRTITGCTTCHSNFNCPFGYYCINLLLGFWNLLSKAYPLCPGWPYHPPVCGITWKFGNQQ